MQRTGIIAVVLLLLLAGGTYFYTQSPQLNEDSELSQDLLSHIPSDSIAFFVTETGLPIEAYSSSDASLAQAMQTMETLTASVENPAGKFWSDLAYRYLRSAQTSPAQLQQDWGFGDTVHSAFYFIGLSPVLELSLASPATAVAQIRAAAEAQGLNLETDSDAVLTGVQQGDQANAAQVQQHRIVFLEGDNKRLSLVIRETETWLRLTVDGPFDEALLALINGETLPEQSLANSEHIAQIRSSLTIKGDVIGSVNFLEMAKGITNPNSSLAQMIEVYADGATPLAELQTPACQSELTAWVAGVPEWVVATNMDFDKSAKQRNMHSEALLRIANPEIAAQLQSLNGVLPAYDSVQGFAPIFSFAMGLNLSQLTPVVMDLHQRLLSQEFSCSYLTDMQAKASEQSPAMLGMATAMVAGLKGFSMSVHDLELDESGMGVNSASALLSISASSIRQLLAMAQSMIPGMGALVIPEDGSATAFESPMIPASIPALKIAIKGEKHVLIYTEDAQAQALADSFNDLSLESSGFLDMRVDAATLFDEDGGLWTQVSGVASAMTQMSPEGCITSAVLKSSYEDAKMKMKMGLTFAEKGLLSDAKVQQNLVDAATLKVKAGRYDGATVGDACVALNDSLEIINADGTGSNQLRDSDSNCAGYDYEAEYQWQQHGRNLEFTFSRERTRGIDDCDAPWSEWKEVDQAYTKESCIVVERTEQGFSCLYSGGGEPFMVKFSHSTAPEA